MKRSPVSAMMASMKRLLIVTAALFMVVPSLRALPGPSGLTLGASLAYAKTIDDFSDKEAADWDLQIEDYPFFGEAGLWWGRPLGLENGAFILGLRAGMVSLIETESPDHLTRYSLSTIPAGLFTRFEAGLFSLDLCGGIHRWNLEYQVVDTNLDNSGFDVFASLSPGAGTLLFGHVAVRTAAVFTYYAIPDIGNGVSANALTAGLLCALNLR